MLNQLTIRIEEDEKGRGLSCEAFEAVFHKSVVLLRDIDRSMSDEGRASVRLVISGASMSSPMEWTVTGLPARDNMKPRDIFTPLLDDARRLAAGKPAKRLTLRQQEVLKDIIDRLGNGVGGIAFRNNGTAVQVTRRMADTISTARGAEQHEVGTVEGRLDVLSVHKGDYITIWDHRYGTAVPCRVSDAQLEEAKQMLGRRVSVRGRIKTLGRRPIEVVDVYQVHAFREDTDLPQPDEIGPIDLFGEEEPADYLRGEIDDD